MSAVERLDEIEARANAATEEPWTVRRYDHGGGRISDPSDRHLVADLYSIGDREFIAAARADVPALVAALRAVEKECASVDASEARGVKVHVGVLYLRNLVRDAIAAALDGAS